jgi:hypothetical protein
VQLVGRVDMRERRKATIRKPMLGRRDSPEDQAAMRDQLQAWLGRWWDLTGGQGCRDVRPKREPYSTPRSFLTNNPR